MRLGKTGPHRRKEGGKGQHLMLERGIALKTRKEKQKTNSIYKNINTRNQSEYGEHHPHFQGMFPSAFTLSHYTHSPTSIWKGKTQFVLKWKAWKETKRGKKSQRTFAFSKNTFTSWHVGRPFPAVLSSRITAVPDDKSNPEPSADRQSPQRENLLLHHESHPRPPPAPTAWEARLRPLWKKAQLCESLQPSRGAWAKSRGQLETAALRSTPTGREEGKEGEFIVYYTWFHAGLRKAGLYFLSQTKSFFSLLT